MPDREHFCTIAGREILFDEEGFLCHVDDWDEEVAVELAGQSEAEMLGEVQWRVLRFLREYYQEHGRSPLNRRIAEGVGLSLLELEGLFAGGIRHGAKRLAGLPNPKRCS